ncbi:MAG: hypothetical protein KBA86_03420 [Bacteroidales bacterium]|nr:hypothetical protein [Bacteroidales bacterium]
MKKVFTFLLAVLLTATVWAQSPNKISYQAVVRNSSNALVTNTQIGMQISILQGSASGTAVYVETQKPTTNANGLVSIEIGGGTVVNGDFATIDWGNGLYFIKTETDINGGTTYTITGTSQLLSVPYALHAKTAETVTNETDPLFVASPANGITSGDIINWNNKLDVEQDSSVINEIQALSISNDTVFLSNGGFIKLPAGFDGQYSSLTGKPTNVSAFANDAGYLTYEKDSSVTNEIELPTSGNAGDMAYWNDTAWVIVAAGNEGQMLSFVGGVPTWTTVIGPTDVYNPTTGEIWMERNLGASRVATSSTDTLAYGDLYQWGRGTDGHEKRNSGTTTTLATSNSPGHGNFITNGSYPWDWRNPQNNNLWQGVSGTNNPCPSGYRLPTIAEWAAERTSWSSNNAAGAFASPLKLPLAGLRNGIATLSNAGSYGQYWSSTVVSDFAYILFFSSNNGYTNGSLDRVYGLPVRCLKD